MSRGVEWCEYIVFCSIDFQDEPLLKIQKIAEVSRYINGLKL